MKNLLFIIFLALIGCSQDKGIQTAIPVKDKKEALKVLTTDQVVCQGQCPEHVGAFYFHYVGADKKNYVGLCSVTLIGADQVLTNKHCIEDRLNEGDFCNGQSYIEIKFPKTGSFSFESFGCKKILKTSQDYFIPGHPGKRRIATPDWTILQLSKATTRKPISKSVGELVGQEVVDIFPVYFDMSYDRPKGVIEPVQCQHTFKTDRFFAIENESPLFKLQRCTKSLVPGNSGSGVFLSGQSQLLGLMSSVASDGDVTGTRAHCLPPFKEAGGACAFSEDQEYTDIMMTIYYLKNYVLPELENMTSNMIESSLVQWSEDPLKGQQNIKIEAEFNSPWSDYLDYLKSQGYDRWHKKLKHHLLSVVIPRQPECAKATPADNLRLRLLSLENWNFLSDMQWTETPREENGNYRVLESLRIQQSNSVITQDIEVDVVEQNKKTTLVAKGALPSIFKSLKMTLPKCQ